MISLLDSVVDSLRQNLISNHIELENETTVKSGDGLASVLVPLQCANGRWQIVLTRRAMTLRHHAGEVAFPGGMWELGDQFPVDTALRESQEEIALERQYVQVLGLLTPLQTRRKTEVTPVVGLIDHPLELSPNDGEIESIFTVPLDFFLNDQRLRTDIFSRQDNGNTHSHWVPAYEYHYQGENYEIWGFTAAVIVQLLNRGFSAGIGRDNSAVEKVW